MIQSAVLSALRNSRPPGMGRLSFSKGRPSGVAMADTPCGALGTGTCGTAELCVDSTLSPPAPTDVTT